jgi:hypothetical protein
VGVLLFRWGPRVQRDITGRDAIFKVDVGGIVGAHQGEHNSVRLVHEFALEKEVAAIVFVAVDDKACPW